MSLADLQTLASIVPLVQTLVFIISVFFVGYQIRENTRLTRAAKTQSLVELSSPFLLQLGQDRNMAELWVNGTKHYETLDAVDQFRYIQLLVWWLILHENIYYQYRSGLVDQQIYEGWQVELRAFIREKRLGLFWDKEMKRFFRTEFRQVVENLIQLG
jgi:hypothetical protein